MSLGSRARAGSVHAHDPRPRPVDRTSAPLHPVLGPVGVTADGGTHVIGRLMGRRAILSEREQDLRAREQELLDRLAPRSSASAPMWRRRTCAASGGPRAARGPLPAGRGRRVQLRQVELHQRAAGRAGAARRGHARPPTASTCCATAPRWRSSCCEAFLLERTYPADAPARHQRRGHARHQRHHPPPRGADPRLRPARPTWCSSSPAPTARSPRASAASWSRSASGARRS